MSLIYRHTKNLRAIQSLLGHSKLESTVRYLGIEVDDALEMAEQTEVCPTRPGGDGTLSGQKRSIDIAFMIVNNRLSSTSLTNSQGGYELPICRRSGCMPPRSS
jgi:hypothetical protein